MIPLLLASIIIVLIFLILVLGIIQGTLGFVEVLENEGWPRPYVWVFGVYTTFGVLVAIVYQVLGWVVR